MHQIKLLLKKKIKSIKMEISQYLNTAKIMAITSFLIGTLIFGFHCIAPLNSGIIMIGLYYVILAFVANLIMFLLLIGIACIRTDAIDDIAKSMLVLMANIPIAAIYFMVVMSS